MPNSSACHILLCEGHLLAVVLQLYSLWRWTTPAPRILIVADVRHLHIPVHPISVPLVDVSIWSLLAPPINLMMDLALRHPTLAVVAGRGPELCLRSLPSYFFCKNFWVPLRMLKKPHPPHPPGIYVFIPYSTSSQYFG